MGRLARAAFALLTAVALVPGPAFAHKLKVFATAVGGVIEGRVYFVGGAPASGARVRVETHDGTILASLETDPSGSFEFPMTAPTDHVIIADTGDGHQAHVTVPAARPPSAPTVAGGPSDLQPALAAVAPEVLRSLVEDAVARQVEPLRHQLNDSEDRVQWRDVLGGLGYILGLAGLAAWLSAGRQRKSRP